MKRLGQITVHQRPRDAQKNAFGMPFPELGWGGMVSATQILNQPTLKQLGVRGMTPMTHLFKRFLSDASGATMVEYSMILTLLVAAIITAVNGVAGTLTTAWATVNTNMGG